MGGWIKLHRKSIDNGWLRNHKLWAIWTYCLLTASHGNHITWVGSQRISLKQGQFVFTRRNASKATGVSEQSIRTIMKRLIDEEALTQQSTHTHTIITICNWESYQSDEEVNQPTNQPTANPLPTKPTVAVELPLEPEVEQNQPTTNPLTRSTRSSINTLSSIDTAKKKPQKKRVKKKVTPLLTEVVLHYKDIVGGNLIPNWNKVNFTRWARSAKKLLLLSDNNITQIKTNMDKIIQYCEYNDLSWNLDTMVKLWDKCEGNKLRLTRSGKDVTGSNILAAQKALGR